jgi:hypothetical protein
MKEDVPEPAAPAGEEHQAELAAAIALGARCEVQPGGKRGTVMCAPTPPTHTRMRTRVAFSHTHNRTRI